MCYEKAVEINPFCAPGWYNKGRVLYLMGRYEESIECYERVIKIDPLNARTWHEMGLALKALGHAAEAEEAFSRARELGGSG
jgi:tetratricopeptide (TPR) repeat protein